MKGVYFFIVLIFLFACSNYKKEVAEDYSFKFPDSILQGKITDTLRLFPFIKKYQAYFDSLTDHKQGLTFTMDTFRNKIYPIAVFYDEKEKHFQKLYRFEVNPQTMEIKIGDTNTGEYITVDEYYKLAPEDKN